MRGNHGQALFLAAAFAGPVLDIADEPSGGIHLYGDSQIGKSTGLKCAASVWGLPEPTDRLKSWRATANGLEGAAAETNDAFLALDEIGMADPKQVGEIVYTIANQTGKARAARDGSARLPRSWRTFFLSTGEVSMAALMAECAGSPKAGQEVRLINVSAQMMPGYGAIQNLHGWKTASDLLAHLNRRTKACHGVAARVFLDRLAIERTRNPDELRQRVLDRRQEVMREMLPRGADRQVISVASRLALTAVAAELAIEFKVLPWDEAEPAVVATSAFHAWLESRGGSGPAEDRQAIKRVRLFLEQFGASRFETLDESGENVRDERRLGIPRAGYRKKTRDGRDVFLFLPETWGQRDLQRAGS